MSKLLTESSYDYQTLYEADVNGNKKLCIEGVFMQADIKNRNGRVYPKHVMAKEVARYMKESIQAGNAFGELNHPPTPQINLDKVSHLITSLKEDGSNFIGKARLLETPMGLIAKALIEGGGKLAVSSRGTGSLRNVGGVLTVQEDFRLATAADIVANPSAPLAVVDAIMEAPDWIYDHVTNEWQLAEVHKEIHNNLKNFDISKSLNKWASSFDIESMARR